MLRGTTGLRRGALHITRHKDGDGSWCLGVHVSNHAALAPLPERRR